MQLFGQGKCVRMAAKKNLASVQEILLWFGKQKAALK
jgi:hypothetical protein